VIVSASIDVTGLTRFNAGLKRSISGDLQKRVVKNIQDNRQPIINEMHSKAHTRIQQRAVGSVDARLTSDGIELAGGAGGGLGGILFDGGEYGGRKSKKVVYATRSPLGRPYIIKRRTTMQFLQWLGREGYFFWPTVRDALKRLTKETEEIVGKTLEGGL
jgi:hypothetical protein